MGVLTYMGYIKVCATVKGKVFKQFTLGLGIIFHETDQLVEDFI